uniref:sigma-E factor negative regulatory protein n=1 Tax=Neptunomonas sp. TaxID=1971898 RepID=UPI003562968C
MSDESNESLSASLSAAMDGEVSSFELRRVLARIQDKKGLDCEQFLNKWQRYHLAQQAIHGEGINQQAVNIDLVSRVSAALESEKVQPAVQSPAAKTPEDTEQHAWWKPVVSMAMAASVTAVVILGGQQFISNDAAVDGSFRQAYTIPSVQSSKDFVRAQYSN